MLPKWREQYDRMKRWRERLNERQSGERRADDLYAFFVCCHHLVEWVSKDGSLDETVRGDVGQLVKNSGALGFAADVTNGFKHLERDRKARVDPTARVSVVGGFHVGWSKPAPSGIVVGGDRSWEDAYALADRCIEDWDGFVRRHNLILSGPSGTRT